MHVHGATNLLRIRHKRARQLVAASIRLLCFSRVPDTPPDRILRMSDFSGHHWILHFSIAEAGSGRLRQAQAAVRHDYTLTRSSITALSRFPIGQGLSLRLSQSTSESYCNEVLSLGKVLKVESCNS